MKFSAHSHNCLRVAVLMEISTADRQNIMNTALPAERCFRCYKTGDLLECACCHATLYCSKKCQIVDWSHHKKHCDPAYGPHARAQRENISRLMSDERLSRFLAALADGWGSLLDHHVYCKIPLIEDVTKCVISYARGKPRNCRPTFGCIVIEHRRIISSKCALSTIIEFNPQYCAESARAAKVFAPHVKFGELPRQNLSILISAFNICICGDNGIQLI